MNTLATNRNMFTVIYVDRLWFSILSFVFCLQCFSAAVNKEEKSAARKQAEEQSEGQDVCVLHGLTLTLFT